MAPAVAVRAPRPLMFRPAGGGHLGETVAAARAPSRTRGASNARNRAFVTVIATLARMALSTRDRRVGSHRGGMELVRPASTDSDSPDDCVR